jgi:UPF0042 nucleotide-binding protein
MAAGLNIIIITGLSGSGRTFAIRALEDNGFFCVDNLPALLIPKFIDLCHGYQEEITRIALGVDLRGGQFLQGLPQVLAETRAAGLHVQILFFTLPIRVVEALQRDLRRIAGWAIRFRNIARERKALRIRAWPTK